MFYLGIEALAMRRSFAALSDARGQILASRRHERGLSFHTTTRPALRTAIVRLITDVRQRAGLTTAQMRDCRCCVAVSGITCPFDLHVELPSDLEPLALDTVFGVHGSAAALASHTQQTEGSVLVCNMDSLAYVSTKSQEKMIGGWGPVLRERASGFEMGCAALRAVLQHYDTNSLESCQLLCKRICEWLRDPADPLPHLHRASLLWKERMRAYNKAKDPIGSRVAVLSSYCHEIARDWGLTAWRVLASSIVTPLMEAAQGGDATARGIVDDSSRETACKLRTALAQAKVDVSFAPLVLFGGVFSHHAFFRDSVVRAVAEACGQPERTIAPADPEAMRPVCGALLLALGGSTASSLRLPSKEIISRISSSQATSPHLEELAND